MKCKMCNNSYCSCKSQCSLCWLDNNTVYFINEAITNWLSQEEAKKNKALLSEYKWKIDSITIVEYIHWGITKEKFDEAVSLYKQTPSTPEKKEYVSPFLWKPNPDEMCVFPEGWDIWSRCIYCNKIKRYMKDKPCPQSKKTLGSTDAKN